jgi:CheY-like chemotaxis protein
VSNGIETRTRLLLVDDDPWMQSIIGDLLQDEGYLVIRARSGDDVLHVAERQHPAAILLDLRLPGVSGIELFRMLKASPTTADIPVLVVSGDRELLDECVELGTVNVFEKPFDLGELITAIDDAARRGLPGPAAGVWGRC